MERDMVLIRKILFAIEEKYTDRALSYHDLGLNDYTPEVFAYHCSLLHDAQLVSSYVSRYADDSHWVCKGVNSSNRAAHRLLQGFQAVSYTHLLREDIYYAAYQKLYANKGATTQGIDNDTSSSCRCSA